MYFTLAIYMPGIQKHGTMRNTKNDTNLLGGNIKSGLFYLFIYKIGIKHHHVNRNLLSFSLSSDNGFFEEFLHGDCKDKSETFPTF